MIPRGFAPARFGLILSGLISPGFSLPSRQLPLPVFR